MSYVCELALRDAQPTLAVRTTTSVQKLPQLLGRVYGQIVQYLGDLNEDPAGPTYTAFYNMDMQNLDVEIGIQVSGELPRRGGIQPGEIPGGEVATCLHTGPYDKIELAYNALMEWIEENGQQVTGVVYELYLTDPAETVPEEYQTRILFPLKAP